MPTPAVELEIGSRTVRVTSPDKVYFPDVGLTKLDVVTYYVTVGEGIFAALQDRPTTMERWPGGYRPDVKLSTRSDAHGEAFYQKRAPSKGMPEWVQTATISFPSGRTADEVCPTELATVVWMGNLGTLRFHPWPVKMADTEKVDQLRIDLDPQPGTDFADAVRAAHELRGVLDDAGLTGYAKTSGGRGVHVFVPIRPDLRIHRGAARRHRPGPRAVPPDARPRHDQLVEGGAGRADLRRLQPDGPGSDDRRGLLDSADPGRPGVRAAHLGRARRRRAGRSDGDLDAHPVRRARRRLEAVLRPAEPGRLEGALEMYERDVRDLGTGSYGGAEMPYPPDYPKMPGEPSRVQPSRARADNPDFAHD